MTTSQEPKQKLGMKRWQKGLLFGSLAMNLAVVGLVAGVAFGGGKFGPPRMHGPDKDAVAPFTRAFTADQRDALRKSLRQSFFENRGERGGIVQDYREALDVLRTEPYDRERMDTLLDQQSARGQSRRQKGQLVLSEFLAGLTAEERATYADRLEEEIANFARRRKPKRHN